MKQNDDLPPFQRLSREVLVENSWHRDCLDRYTRSDGSKGRYDYIDRPGAVGIIPLFEDGSTILLRQRRYLLDLDLREILGKYVSRFRFRDDHAPGQTPRETRPMNPTTPTDTRASKTGWRIAQLLLGAVGLGIMAALVVRPGLGLHAFWNVLIPVAPAIVVFLPGVWRNVCPLGSAGLLPRHLGLSRQGRLSERAQGQLAVAGVMMLFLIVPLRHVVLDLSGPATALMLLVMAFLAILFGGLLEWKSGWCSGACPVHAVERLYGASPGITPSNAHCKACARCVTHCPDANPQQPVGPQASASTFMIGAFPGFIWGWFHVPNFTAGDGWSRLDQAYLLPLGVALATLIVYLTVRRALGTARRPLLNRAFAAAAVGCYYWYRIPALFGLGLYPGDGQLVDLSAALPDWFLPVSRAATTLLFALWLTVGHKPADRPWARRPAPA